MKCAIITCSEYKKKLFKKRYVVRKLSFLDIKDDICVINLTYNNCRFDKLKHKKSLCKELIRFLLKENIMCVYMAGIVNCSDFSDISKHFYTPDGKNILKCFVGLGANALFSASDKNIDNIAIAFYLKSYSYENFKILYDLSQYFKNITVVGCNEREFLKYRDKIFDTTGLCIEHTSDYNQGFDLLILNDKFDDCLQISDTIILDLCKQSDLSLNGAKFFLPANFNKLLPYFGIFDDICLEFLFFADDNRYDISNFISRINGKFKMFFCKNCNKN